MNFLKSKIILIFNFLNCLHLQFIKTMKENSRYSKYNVDFKFFFMVMRPKRSYMLTTDHHVNECSLWPFTADPTGVRVTWRHAPRRLTPLLHDGRVDHLLHRGQAPLILRTLGGQGSIVTALKSTVNSHLHGVPRKNWQQFRQSLLLLWCMKHLVIHQTEQRRLIRGIQIHKIPVTNLL